MGKRIYTDEQRKERARERSRLNSLKRSQDPVLRAKNAANAKARYHIKKHDPNYVKKVNEKNLNDYYKKVRPFPDKMELRRARIKQYQQKRRTQHQAVKIQLQQVLGSQCASCGLTDPRLLDFDHIDPKTKTMNISQHLAKGFDALLEEVKKCQLLCPNCHRLKTLENQELDSYKHREYRNQFRGTFKPLIVNS